MFRRPALTADVSSRPWGVKADLRSTSHAVNPLSGGEEAVNKKGYANELI